MPKVFSCTITDVEITSLSIHQLPDGTLKFDACYFLLDDEGNRVEAEGLRYLSEALDGTQTFSSLLGLVPQQITGRTNAEVKVARDVVRDHVRDLVSWVRARLWQAEGL